MSYITDNCLMVRLLPSLTMTLLMGLRIPELVEALQKLWYFPRIFCEPV